MQLRYLLRTGQFVFKNTLWTNTTAYVNSISEGHFKHCLLHRSFHKSVTLKDSPRKFVLGIETSCDDTGAAVVDDKGNILGEALNSQTSMTNKYVIVLLKKFTLAVKYLKFSDQVVEDPVFRMFSCLGGLPLLSPP